MPPPSRGGGGPSRGGSRAIENTAQATISTISPPSRSVRTRRTSIARGPASGVADAAANTDAMISPTGVAIANPMFGLSRSTPGVTSACRPRNPAVERNASEISVSRASR